MTCAGCEQHIKAELQKLKGVVVSEVSYINGSAKIQFDAKQVTVSQITQNIQATGYKVVKHKIIIKWQLSFCNLKLLAQTVVIKKQKSCPQMLANSFTSVSNAKPFWSLWMVIAACIAVMEICPVRLFNKTKLVVDEHQPEPYHQSIQVRPRIGV